VAVVGKGMPFTLLEDESLAPYIAGECCGHWVARIHSWVLAGCWLARAWEVAGHCICAWWYRPVDRLACRVHPALCLHLHLPRCLHLHVCLLLALTLHPVTAPALSAPAAVKEEEPAVAEAAPAQGEAAMEAEGGAAAGEGEQQQGGGGDGDAGGEAPMEQ
jgi:hypothetical protein